MANKVGIAVTELVRKGEADGELAWRANAWVVLGRVRRRDANRSAPYARSLSRV